MAKNQENHFWYRRVSITSIIGSLFIIGLSVLPVVAGDKIDIDPSLRIDQSVLMLAGFTIIISVLALANPLKKHPDLMPFLSQTLLWITVVTAVLTTGGLTSPLLALWVPAVIFTGLFGINGLLPAITASIGYLVWLYSTESLDITAVVAVTLAGILPAVLGYVIFSQLTKGMNDSSYTKLANEFSEISDKSNVVINAITNGVIALNNQGLIELINPAAQRILGWDGNDAINLNYKSVLKMTDEDGKETSAANDPVAIVLSSNKERRTDDLSLSTNSGKKIQASIAVSPVGRPGSGIIVVFRDITKEKTEEREQTEFISTASHEMRTPVASIEGYLGLALNPTTAQIDDKAREYITKAQEVAQHLGRLFQDLLDISKAEDGRLTNNPKVVEVVDFTQGIVDGLRPSAESKGLSINYKPDPSNKTFEKVARKLNPVFYANVDNDHLREIVSNLIENAIKYTQQGSVTIDVTGNDSEVTISIEDTGIGIPTEDISHLFQKFYRVDNSETREIGGTGLGLYLSRKLVEGMGGKIKAESKYKQGSTFYVSVPRISHQEAMQIIETLDSEPANEIIREPSATLLDKPVANTPPDPEAIHNPMMEEGSGGVFSSPSASSIAEQLTKPKQPPATISPSAEPSAPALANDNPSIEMIESNPEEYLRQQKSRQVPPRT